jgi:hypothetical protein
MEVMMAFDKSWFDNDTQQMLKQTVKQRRDSLIAPLKKIGPIAEESVLETITNERSDTTPIVTYDTKRLRRAR